MGLFDKFKKKKDEVKINSSTSKSQQDDFDYEITPDMYDFRPKSYNYETKVDINDKKYAEV